MGLSRVEIRKELMIAIYQYLLIDADIFSYLEETKIDIEDEFVLTILENVLKKQEEYKQLLNARLNEWTFDRLGAIEQAILLLAVAEKDSGLNEKAVVINEAVELTKIYCEEDSYRLINATLDKL